MTYAVANLHGCYGAFKRLLEKINFKDDDVMFVLGDMVDYGDESMELLEDLSVRYNIYPIAGEHDRKAYKMLKAFYSMLKDGTAPDADYIAEMNEWVSDGGKPTLDAFTKLDDDTKEGVLDYLEELPAYETAECGGREYVLVHAGIASFSPKKELEDYAEEDFITEPLDMDKRYFDSAYVVAGHISTYDIDGANEGKIYRKSNNYAIDCAIAFDGYLGCLCLDNGKEYYVQ